MRTLLVLAILSGSLVAAEPCRVKILDQETRWPVPLVELRTTDHQRFVSDNAGVIALDSPELFDQETWFNLIGHGYELKADGFGFQGIRFTPIRGSMVTIEVTRKNIAKRIGRLTGSGLFAESQKCGEEREWRDSPIVGCDSVQMVTNNNQRFWLWGDTTLARYPLGIFDVLAATTPLEPWMHSGREGNHEPPLRPKYSYILDDRAKPRGVAKFPGSGPTWIFGLTTVQNTDHKLVIVGTSMKVRNHLEVYEYAQCVWDDATKNFVKQRVIWTKSKDRDQPPRLPEGQAVDWVDANGRSWRLFGNPFPRIQCPATLDGWLDPKQWIELQPQESLRDAKGNMVVPHSGSIGWHPWRKKWVTVFMEKFGKPSVFGELWYAEAASPFGPWGTAVKVLTHANYTFYNPRVHTELATRDSPELLFEGTYTAEFAKDPPPTPRYNYNQVLYRLDLNDPRLKDAQK